MNQTTPAFYIPDSMDCRTCNLCMSHCPTFKIKQTFEQSPQGRLRLIAKVLQQGGDLSSEEIEQLNDCVECRACEKLCPSRMRYAKLLRKTRTKLSETVKPLMLRVVMYLTRRRALLRRSLAALRIYQKSGLRAILKRLGLFKLTRTEEFDELLPMLPPYQDLSEFYPAVQQKRGSVALFTGCLTNALQNPQLHAAVKVLTRLGYDVHVPRQQVCCGAIHSHNDAKHVADQLAETNLDVFTELDVEAILFTASGCGSPLQQYKRRNLSEGAQTKVPAFEPKLKEINQFIAEAEWPAQLELLPLDQLVLVHEPCSQQFPLGTHKSPYEFLGRIPGIRVEPLPENNICCGAGGSYMLTHPQMSSEIREQKLAHIRDSEAKVVLTSNIGCALHLAAGIEAASLGVRVAHPVELLAQQIK